MKLETKCKDIELFKDNYVESYHPLLGLMRIYMKRDKNMGKVYLVDKNFITPNMPKLPYFSKFISKYDELSVELLPQLNPELEKYKDKTKAYVFRKDDGTNILFYKLNDRIIPKTRMNGIASTRILKALNDPRFPEKEIKELVNDDFIPIIELWGADIVNKYNILNGGTNVKLLEELEGRNGYNATIINILKADYTNCEYQYMHPKTWIKLAREYGLEHAKLLKTTKINYEELQKTLKQIENLNKKYNTNVIEGGVVHVYHASIGYGMFKMKTANILLKDIIVNTYNIPPEKIKYEVNKILSSFDPVTISKNFNKYFEMLLKELENDTIRKNKKFSKKQTKLLKQLFIKELVNYLIEEYSDKDLNWFIQQRITPCIIGVLRSRIKK